MKRSPFSGKTVVSKSSGDRQPTLEEVAKARAIAAGIVREYGDAYLVMFERIDSDYRKLKKLRESLEACLDEGTKTAPSPAPRQSFRRNDRGQGELF